MQISAGGGRSGGRRSRGVPVLAEINVTPFVDVVLVLLIIFMITAHAMESGIEINVPKTKSVQATTKDLPIVSITKAGEVYLGKEAVNINRLAADIRARYPGQQAVYLRGDSETPWDPMAKVMSVLGAAKLDVSVVTEPDDATGRRR